LEASLRSANTSLTYSGWCLRGENPDRVVRSAMAASSTSFLSWKHRFWRHALVEHTCSGAVLLWLLLLKVELPRRNVHHRRWLQGGTFLRAGQVLPPTCRLLGAQGLLVRWRGEFGGGRFFGVAWRWSWRGLWFSLG
jgi:hypothetical protein